MSKVILTHEVTGLGAPGDVIEVKNGYARNYLVPQGFATPWTRGGEKQVEQIKAARAARELELIGSRRNRCCDWRSALRARWHRIRRATVDFSIRDGVDMRTDISEPTRTGRRLHRQPTMPHSRHIGWPDCIERVVAHHSHVVWLCGADLRRALPEQSHVVLELVCCSRRCCGRDVAQMRIVVERREGRQVRHTRMHRGRRRVEALYE